jgi:hypothetical protein
VNERSRRYHLMVEAEDDKQAVLALLGRHSIDCHHPVRIEIKAYDGAEDLLLAAEVALKSDYRLGLLLDADTSALGRWKGIRIHLQNAGITTLPEVPVNGGTIVRGFRQSQRIGIWLMPDNVDSGKLETFLAKLIPPGDTCWAYAQAATLDAKKNGAKYRSVDTIKAQLRAWLAWQSQPGLPFGTAMTQAYFRHDTPEALAFIAWFQRLFLNP